ncbi:TPA: hypothetical protein EYN98_27010 [Candidatus Poribacteria bacterium]|nr:hypothetical protein [Candidatus Poribacteria bacterium]HIB90361.1 hypothetical protein [Candidatus Poribacteria bacterium]HIN31875.1 hypothetical protein [Candidatus Poribacteria bacterium]
MRFGRALLFNPLPTQETTAFLIFNCYNTVNSKWHNWDPHPDHVAEMPTKRQTLFRPVHVAGNVIGGQYQD